MNLESVRAWFEVSASLVTALGFPIAILTYRHSKQADRVSREQEQLAAQARADETAYTELNKDYNAFLVLCIQFPHFDLGDAPLQDPPTLDPLQQSQRLSLFNIFLGLAERAFLLYRGTSSTLRTRQWNGWQTYIVEVLCRTEIFELYESQKLQYDLDFVETLDRWLLEAKT